MRPPFRIGFSVLTVDQQVKQLLSTLYIRLANAKKAIRVGPLTQSPGRPPADVMRVSSVDGDDEAGPRHATRAGRPASGAQFGEARFSFQGLGGAGYRESRSGRVLFISKVRSLLFDLTEK